MDCSICFIDWDWTFSCKAVTEYSKDTRNPQSAGKVLTVERNDVVSCEKRSVGTLNQEANSRSDLIDCDLPNVDPDELLTYPRCDSLILRAGLVPNMQCNVVGGTMIDNSLPGLWDEGQ